MKTHKIFNFVITFVFVFSLLGAPMQVSAQEPAFPSVDIAIYNNSAYASNWPAGAEVTISFGIPADDIESNEIEWVYSETAIAPVWDGGGWCQFIFNIDPAEFRIAAGQAVRITDGTTTRQATIPDLTVTSEDPTADTLTGTAVPGSTVNLFTWSSETGVVQRNAVANSNKVWFADFAHPGTGSDEQGTFDVIPGNGRLFGFFWISQPINDFVGIKFMWDFGPYFHVFPEEERIETYVWPRGANLTLTIDDPSTTEKNPDLTQNQVNLDWQTNFDNLGTILPGFIVSITDGLVTKTHIITDLTVTGADSQTDTVTGTAEPSNIVDLRICCGNNGWVNRHASAGDNRIWLVDFSVPGEGVNEQDVYNIHPGEVGEVQQADIDGDTTKLYWRALNPPSFSVLPDDESIEGNDWPLDSILTIKIGDLDNPDYTTTTSVNPPDQDHSQTWFKLEFANIFDLQPGQIVTVFDAKTTRQTIVTNRTITDIDPVTDTITGAAGSNIANVVLWACDDNGCGARYKDVNPDGSWSVNFAIPGEQGWEDGIVDIQPDTNGGIYQGDADGDGTTYQQWTVTVLPWTLKGFYQPVDMNGVYNTVKNGSTVPLKFEIFAGSTELTDVANIKSLTYAQTSCDATATTDAIETIATGGTSLRYADGQFIYNWKTPKSTGKCYRVTITAVDGTTLMAYFKLK